MIARELYPDMGNEPFYGPCDYQPIIDSFGDVLIQVDDDDYQGDTRVLFSAGGRYGFLNFGWGSCSGCDGLQSCRTYSDIDALIESLRDDIKWFDTLAEAQAYIADPERAGSYYSHRKEWDDFKAKVAEAQP